MRQLLLLILLGCSLNSLFAQDSLSKSNWQIGAYMDFYYAYDASEPESKQIPYFVSSALHNQLSCNLAFIHVQYDGERVRARFRPAIGSYMQANYAAEPEGFRYIYEGYVGLKLSSQKNIWLDAGIYASPVTNESAFSFEQIMYTRSFAPEYVPYYLCGAKLSLPIIDQKLQWILHVSNGWQQIVEQNDAKSIISQWELKPNAKHLINWNIYVGSEQSPGTPFWGTRIFSDLFWQYNPNSQLAIAACVYRGWQMVLDGNNSYRQWTNANIAGSYTFAKDMSINGRYEFFDDPSSTMIANYVMPSEGFRSHSLTAGIGKKWEGRCFLRAEARYFFSDKWVYLNKNLEPSKQKWVFTLGLSTKLF